MSEHIATLQRLLDEGGAVGKGPYIPHRERSAIEAAIEALSRTPQPVTPAGGEVGTLQRARLLALHRGLELARKWSCDGAAGNTGTHFADSLIRRMGEQMRVALSSQDGDYTHPFDAGVAALNQRGGGDHG